jgi:hypothetical protein
MEVANGDQNIFLPLIELPALFTPLLDPPVEGGAKKGEWPDCHLLMLRGQALPLQISLISQPSLIEASRLDDVHRNLTGRQLIDRSSRGKLRHCYDLVAISEMRHSESVNSFSLAPPIADALPGRRPEEFSR